MDLKKATRDELILAANELRRGPVNDPKAAFQMAKRLAALQCMDEARRVAEHISTSTLPTEAAVELRQKWALWTSKNPDGPDDSKHDEALKILDGIQFVPGGASLSRTTDPETLGIAGGILKRAWQVDGQRSSLDRSLEYYERGAASGVTADNGYTAINAAFVSDLMASLDQETVPCARARELRQAILDVLPPRADQPAYKDGPVLRTQRWFHETVAEAYFGLQRYEDASRELGKVDWSEVEPWERETTARQFAWLAHLLEPDADTDERFQASEAWKVLRTCFGGDASRGAGSLFAGKLGLALSGGGFRASFFHIGVLAGLAELDMLRHVEVLSCVSGGSILGAYYYLAVRQLLQEHPDGDITREQYVELVETMAREFRQGVQKNIRMRIGTNLWANLKMMLLPGYTRTSRIGELYEEHLYSRVKDADDEGRQERRLRKLKVRPRDDEACLPKYDNWRRNSKVPILVLNATTVNTGHNWQFTSSWMGEPPSQIESKVDANFRLRRMYLENEAPPPHNDIHIGAAAAASSCVPGLFTPLELRGLYPGLTVRLVDGGVHDNQGVFGLLDQNCTVLIVSDASGQMGTMDAPSDGTLSVLLRTTDMTMARVRVTQFRELDSRMRSGRLRGLLFLHLKDELAVRDRDWLKCKNPKQLTPDQLRKAAQEVTGYGILKPLQEKLANVRTDLDSFSNAEAFALMASGCRMIRDKFAPSIKGFPTSDKQHEWQFLAVDAALREPDGTRPEPLSRLLTVASYRAFKVWRLEPALRGVAMLAGAGALAALAWAAWQFRQAPFNTGRGLAAASATAVLAYLATSLGLGALVRIIRYRKTVHQILIGIGLAIVGWAGCWLHLGVFDRRFLTLGEWKK